MDYKNMKAYKSSTEAKGEYAKRFHTAWWAETEPKLRAESMSIIAGKMLGDADQRLQANLRHARLYENVDLGSLSGATFSADVVRQAVMGAGIISLNVIASCIDTLSAKITKNKPRPSFLTTGGNWPQQQKARKLDLFMRGLFYETDVYNKAKNVGTDAFTWGTGMLQLFQNDDGRLECERVSIDEIFVDDADGHDGNPRQMFRRKFVQREVLCKLFPEYTDEILAAPAPADINTITSTIADMVEVWEAWHLPSKDGAEDGKHAISIDGCEVFCEDWKVCRFPFVVLRFKKRLRGYWGKGVAEELTGIQLELNRLMRSVSEQLRRKGRGRIFVQTGSKVNPNHLTNDIGDVVSYTGSPPIIDNVNAVAQEEFMQIDRLFRYAFQIVGISELSAMAKKPSGLDAAVALREYSDIESERFALIHQAWEQFFLDYAATSLELITKQWGHKGYKIKTPSKRYIIEVDWRDINLDEDSYVMQMFPVSSLPQTPAAKYAKVKEMMMDGFIDKPVAQRLLEFPDIDAEQNLGNAAIDDVDATISAVMDEKVPELRPIEIYQNAQLLQSRATAAYLYGRHHGAEEERLDMLRQLIDQATMILAPPMDMPMGGAVMPPPIPGLANVPAQAGPIPGPGPAPAGPVPGQVI